MSNQFVPVVDVESPCADSEEEEHKFIAFWQKYGTKIIIAAEHPKWRTRRIARAVWAASIAQSKSVDPL